MRCILVATSAYVSLELTSEVPTQGSGDAGAVDLAKAMVDCPGEGLMALRLRGHQAWVPSPWEPRNAVDMAPFGLKTDQKRVGALPEPQEIDSSTMAILRSDHGGFCLATGARARFREGYPMRPP